MNFLRHDAIIHLIGVGAIFISTLALSKLPNPQSPPQNQSERLAASLHPIVSFVVLGSILIRRSLNGSPFPQTPSFCHIADGLSIPFFNLGRRTVSLTSTWSRPPPTPEWLSLTRRVGKPEVPSSADDIVTMEQGGRMEARPGDLSTHPHVRSRSVTPPSGETLDANIADKPPLLVNSGLQFSVEGMQEGGGVKEVEHHPDAGGRDIDQNAEVRSHTLPICKGMICWPTMSSLQRNAAGTRMPQVRLFSSANDNYCRGPSYGLFTQKLAWKNEGKTSEVPVLFVYYLRFYMLPTLLSSNCASARVKRWPRD